MFDFKRESKEKYFREAEKLLKDKKLDCFQIERDRISIVKDIIVKVYVVPFTKKEVSKEELAAVKAIPEFRVINDRYTRRSKGKDKPVKETGYFELRLI